MTHLLPSKTFTRITPSSAFAPSGGTIGRIAVSFSVNGDEDRLRELSFEIKGGKVEEGMRPWRETS